MNVDIIKRDTAEILIFRAMIMAEKRAGRDLSELFKLPPEVNAANVVMTVNGVEVDVIEALVKTWEIMRSHMEEDVLVKAKELVSTARLDKLRDALDVAERDIISILESSLTTAKEQMRGDRE